MIGKRIQRTCGVLVLALALAVLPSAGQGAIWVGAQLGANFAANTDVNVNVPGVSFVFKDVKVEPSVIGGITIGYDFVREGFLGYNYPDWMKYFSFATDFTFNRFDMREQWVQATANGVPAPTPGGKAFFPTASLTNPTGTRVEGTMAVWSFLFMFKYGFFPDSEVPFGRLQPFLAVGPGIMFSTLQGKFLGVTNSSSSSVDIALVTEAGLRYMCLKNVSLDLIFRYRFGAPSYSFNAGGVKVNGVGAEVAGAAVSNSRRGGSNLDVDFDAHQFSALVRASYHF